MPGTVLGAEPVGSPFRLTEPPGDKLAELGQVNLITRGAARKRGSKTGTSRSRVISASLLLFGGHHVEPDGPAKLLQSLDLDPDTVLCTHTAWLALNAPTTHFEERMIHFRVIFPPALLESYRPWNLGLKLDFATN